MAALAARPELPDIPDELTGMPVGEVPLREWEYPACVYFLLDEGRVVYVGKTTGLIARVGQHAQPRGAQSGVTKRFQRVLYFPCYLGLLELVESALIKILRPRDNRAGLIGRNPPRVNVVEEQALKNVGLGFMLDREPS